jgi:hypothetical protein
MMSFDKLGRRPLPGEGLASDAHQRLPESYLPLHRDEAGHLVYHTA